MAGEWRETTLGEVTDFLSGGTPSKDRPDYWTGSVPWVSAKDMKRFRLDDTEDHVSDEGIENGTKLVPAGSVLLLTRGMTLLNDLPICVINRPMTFNQDVKALRPKSHVRTDYLPYLLLGNKYRLLSLVDLAGHGTGRLNSDELKALDVALPPLPEQQAIAHILGTLDEKIDLNRRMNETLEAMARALFKSWFVDFDPVRAKAEGRDPGLPKALSDLFPARLVESELGEIPEGWEVKVLDDLSAVVLGGDWGTDEPSPDHTERTRCIRGADIPDLQSGGMGKMPVRYLKPSSLEKRGLSDGDLVVEISGGSPTQSTGRPVLVSNRLLQRLDAPLVCSNFCRLLKPKKRVYSKFIYLWLRALYSADELLQFENGTTGIKNLAFTLFSSRYILCTPTDDVLAEFEAKVAPAFSRQQSTAAESDSLSALRDTLLPKLISGDLRVKDAERFTEETA